MNLKRLIFLFLLLLCCSTASVYAQYGRTTNTNTNTNPFVQGDTSHRRTAKPLTDEELLDSTRKKLERKGDSVIFTSKFIKVTNERLLNDSTQVVPLDTTLNNFENYSALYQPRSPKIGLGNLGLAYRNLLFEPAKTIGFDVGLHSLDAYLLKPEDVTYYRARTPFTNLYYVNGALKEQVFRVTHTQNIKPNWNAGFDFNRIGSLGFYPRQKSDHLEAAIFTWYESKNKRYNLLGNLTFNNLKAPENGSILNDTIFNKTSSSTGNSSLAKSAELVRLNNSRDNWRNNSFYIKQFYYIGKTEGLKTGTGPSSSVLPTQRISHTFTYNRTEYKYLQDEADLNNVFPLHLYDTNYSRDSLAVIHLRNDFSYSFYLRGKAVKFVKNELKLDLGLVHDYYKYSQWVRQPIQAATTNVQLETPNAGSFQDITLKARLGYNLSDRAGLDVNLQQITLGREFGDYLYDAKLNVLLGNKIGRVIMEAYTQNNTPPLIYTSWYSSHYQFTNNPFSKVKTTGLSFNYLNEKLQLEAKAEYFLLTNYLYFAADTTYSNNLQPKQYGSAINLLKLSLAKNFTWRGFHLDNYFVYQKTDNNSILRTPEFYTYNSFYYNKRFFNVLGTSYGFAVRYNSTYPAQAYAPGIGQFYNNSNITFPSYPVIDFFIKGTLRRTNLFLKYDYANQGLFSKGYYTVVAPGANNNARVGYPMPDALLKFGVSWNFYD